MRRLRLYLDTSVWARLGDDTNSDRRKWTIRFLHRTFRRHELLTSPLVRSEIGRVGNLEKRSALQKGLAGYDPTELAPGNSIRIVAAELTRIGGFGAARLADLLHTGYAVHGLADLIATWDVRTFAHDSVRAALEEWGNVRRVNVPLIGTPTEILKWLNL